MNAITLPLRLLARKDATELVRDKRLIAAILLIVALTLAALAATWVRAVDYQRVALPSSGTYAVAVRHDADGDNRRGDLSDGGGFSRNPKLSLLKARPNFPRVAVPVGNGMVSLNVILNYRQGLMVGPLKAR